MEKAVFLDRDGVISQENSYVKNVDDLLIYPFAEECVRFLHKMGFLAIVITNQSGIARGYFTENELQLMNKRLVDEVGIDRVYYCPHYLRGIVRKYSIKCTCRKPATGMIEKACSDYKIDIGKSFLIGDRESDIRTGKNANLKTILVRTGYGTQEEMKGVQPDYICGDLRDAVRICVGKKEVR